MALFRAIITSPLSGQHSAPGTVFSVWFETKSIIPATHYFTVKGIESGNILDTDVHVYATSWGGSKLVTMPKESITIQVGVRGPFNLFTFASDTIEVIEVI